MGLFEKRRFRKFLLYIDQYVAENPQTHEGRDLTKMTMRELYTDFGLQPDTHQFISHAMCLQLDEAHMDVPALETVKELQTYCYSLSRYGTSPYIYPIYGLGGLPEGFSRICAIHGGTFMLNQDIDEILYENGKAVGVKAGNQMAKAQMVIGDPSYFPSEKIKATGEVVRCICLLNHPIPNTNDAESVQIIIPGPQVGRKNDVFVCCMGNTLQATAPGIYVAIVSTIAEKKGNPDEDVVPGLQLLGPILKRFTSVTTTYEPVSDGSTDACFISKSFDATSHFESDCDDLLSLYKRVSGEDLDMNINADSVEGDY
jgi:Rab GDP dissociation inhibitor